MPQSHSWNNYFTIFVLSIFIGCFPFFSAMMFRSDNIHWIVALVINLAVFWLYFEAIWNSVVTIQLENGVLTVSKPLRKWSLLTKKKHHQVVIRPDEWDELFYRTYRDATWFYFRKERTAAYYFAIDGISGLSIDLKLFFEDKKIEAYDGFKPDVVKKLKKNFPERVL